MTSFTVIKLYLEKRAIGTQQSRRCGMTSGFPPTLETARPILMQYCGLTMNAGCSEHFLCLQRRNSLTMSKTMELEDYTNRLCEWAGLDLTIMGHGAFEAHGPERLLVSWYFPKRMNAVL